MEQRLAGKNIIITGASRGIGRACVLQCLAEGAEVIAVARQEVSLTALKELTGSERLRTIAADVGKADDINALFDNVRETVGVIDGLVQCAAYFYKAPLISMASEEWQKVMDVNMTGAFLCLQKALEMMRRNGSVVNIGSLSGVPGVEKFDGFTAYNVSKYGLTGLTEIAAVEARGKGVRVNQVSPGAVNTDMLKEAAPQLPPAMIPEEVADVIIFLLSDHSRAVNGENIILTGHPDGPDSRSVNQ